MNPNETAKGVEAVSPPQVARQFRIYAKDFTSVDQAVPLPLTFGRPKRFAMVQITPVFGFRSVPITTDQGK
jgi:hypothetical protein